VFSDAYHDEDDDEDDDRIDSSKFNKRTKSAQSKPRQQRSVIDHKKDGKEDPENEGNDNDEEDEDEDEDEHTVHVDEARMTPAERAAHARAATLSEHHGADAMEYMHHTTVMAQRIKEVRYMRTGQTYLAPFVVMGLILFVFGVDVVVLESAWRILDVWHSQITQ
jgi:hypothetical protein